MKSKYENIGFWDIWFLSTRYTQSRRIFDDIPESQTRYIRHRRSFDGIFYENEPEEENLNPSTGEIDLDQLFHSVSVIDKAKKHNDYVKNKLIDLHDTLAKDSVPNFCWIISPCSVTRVLQLTVPGGWDNNAS